MPPSGSLPAAPATAKPAVPASSRATAPSLRLPVPDCIRPVSPARRIARSPGRLPKSSSDLKPLFQVWLTMDVNRPLTLYAIGRPIRSEPRQITARRHRHERAQAARSGKKARCTASRSCVDGIAKRQRFPGRPRPCRAPSPRPCRQLARRGCRSGCPRRQGRPRVRHQVASRRQGTIRDAACP